MTARDAKRAARQYVEECGSACPHCRSADHMRRVRGRSRIPALEQREMVVSCYCAACGGEWDERYVLTAVTLRRARCEDTP